MHILRSQFADMKPDEAMSFLLNQMRKTKNNDELLAQFMLELNLKYIIFKPSTATISQWIN
jgi:hypothetical protein